MTSVLPAVVLAAVVLAAVDLAAVVLAAVDLPAVDLPASPLSWTRPDEPRCSSTSVGGMQTARNAYAWLDILLGFLKAFSMALPLLVFVRQTHLEQAAPPSEIPGS